MTRGVNETIRFECQSVWCIDKQNYVAVIVSTSSTIGGGFIFV